MKPKGASGECVAAKGIGEVWGGLEVGNDFSVYAARNIAAGHDRPLQHAWRRFLSGRCRTTGHAIDDLMAQIIDHMAWIARPCHEITARMACARALTEQIDARMALIDGTGDRIDDVVARAADPFERGAGSCHGIEDRVARGGAADHWLGETGVRTGRGWSKKTDNFQRNSFLTVTVGSQPSLPTWGHQASGWGSPRPTSEVRMIRLAKRMAWAAFGIGTVIGSGLCFGETHHISDMSIREGDWILKPVYTLAADHSAARVDAVVALRDPSTIVGDNLSIVLFARDPDPALSWSSKAWSGTQDQAGIIKEIKGMYEVPDSEDWVWEVKTDLEIAAAVAKGAPEEVEKGLLTSDPYSTMIPLGSIRELAVKFLSDIGYKAADVPVEKTGDETTGCRDNALNRMALGVETYFTFQGTDEQRELAGYAAATPIVLPGEPDRCDVPGNTNACLQIWTWPAVAYGESFCGPWAVLPHTTSGPIPITLETCYVRNCTQLQRSTVMVQNNCPLPPTVSISYLYRTVGYTEGCCVLGMGGIPPPIPCTPNKQDLNPSPWTPTIPPVPGVPPGGTPTWPVLIPRQQPPR